MATIARWVVVGLALMIGGWAVFDGLHAFTTGNYVTPRTGAHAGRLGPWADLLRVLGLDPLSAGVKTFFLALGAAWLGAAIGFALGAAWARPALLVVAVASLWYAPVGTLTALVELLLLLTLARA